MLPLVAVLLLTQADGQHALDPDMPPLTPYIPARRDANLHLRPSLGGPIAVTVGGAILAEGSALGAMVLYASSWGSGLCFNGIAGGESSCGGRGTHVPDAAWMGLAITTVIGLVAIAAGIPWIVQTLHLRNAPGAVDGD
jgi:hypothetical protein